MRTRKRFGQHFLEPVWADKVLTAILPAPDDVFLEIGPGTGVLTLRLAARVSRLIAIEIDRDLAAELTPRLPPQATVIQGDVLEADVEGILPADARLRVAGNLPYNISSPILFRLLALAQERPIVDATLMLQREVADRVSASPGSADYGVLSVLAQWHAEVTTVLTLPPGAFRPPPKVRSALVRLAFRPQRLAVDDPALFERLVRQMFMQRRKTVANAIDRFGTAVGVPAHRALAAAGIDGTRRPQTLDIIEIARLADAFSDLAK